MTAGLWVCVCHGEDIWTRHLWSTVRWPLPNFRASCGFKRACTALSPNEGNNSPHITREAAFKYFISYALCSRPNRSLFEQAVSLKKKRRKQDGRRMPACSVSFHCILNKRHLEVCAYPNTYACKSKAHKHLFKAALTYRVFKLFTAAACETYQNVHIFFPRLYSLHPSLWFDVPVKNW